MHDQPPTTYQELASQVADFTAFAHHFGGKMDDTKLNGEISHIDIRLKDGRSFSAAAMPYREGSLLDILQAAAQKLSPVAQSPQKEDEPEYDVDMNEIMAECVKFVVSNYRKAQTEGVKFQLPDAITLHKGSHSVKGLMIPAAESESIDDLAEKVTSAIEKAVSKLIPGTKVTMSKMGVLPLKKEDGPNLNFDIEAVLATKKKEALAKLLNPSNN